MKIRMLGTGYGECKLTKKYSKEYRARGGVLINETMLIDAPCDVVSTIELIGMSEITSSINHILISHSHLSHFSNDTIKQLAKNKAIHLYASDYVLSLVDCENVIKHPLTPFEGVRVGDEYKIIPLPSNHSGCDNEICFNFIIANDRVLYYALDGGQINYESYRNFLSKIKVDCVILDCALGLEATSFKSLFHNNIYAANEIKTILLSGGVCRDNARFILSHIPTDKKRLIHEELTPIAKELGFILSYDGLFINI